MSWTIHAFHLPGIAESDIARWTVRDYGNGRVQLRVPVLEPELLERVVARLRGAGPWLREQPVARIVDAIDAVAERLADPADHARRTLEEALPELTGYSPPMIRLILERTIPLWRRDALERLLVAEFGDPARLDGFTPRPGGGSTRPFGPELAFHVFAGNVPGVAVTSLVRALLVKAPSLGKAAAGEPLFAAVFARTLAEVDPRLGECLAVTYWRGGDHALEDVALRAADTVVVYGGEDAVNAIRSRTPHTTRLLEHGPRLSFAVVAREALARGIVDGTAEEAALAVATFDQQGCVSPHVIYVEEGGNTTPRAFAETLAGAMHRVEAELPRGTLQPAEAAAIQHVRGTAEFRMLGGRDVRVFASRGTQFTVIWEADPSFNPSCLNRVVWVKPVASIEDVVTLVRPFAPWLQTVGIAADAERATALANRLGPLGVSRVASLRDMPWPPPQWHHDGSEPLRELVRWMDLEV